MEKSDSISRALATAPILGQAPSVSALNGRMKPLHLLDKCAALPDIAYIGTISLVESMPIEVENIIKKDVGFD